MKRSAGFVLALMLVICGSSFASTAVTSSSTPVIRTSAGTISALEVRSAAPWLKIKDLAGKESILMIDPISSSAWRGGNKSAWAELKVGEMVKVRHTEKGGSAVIKTVEII
ncbi:MAG: hypothetical protein COT00_02420 [Candidatus Omnitrophica bacterium CG07_land_8_20_14_0_80_50_8]|nr:MAG: hypothetical protein AUJ71_04750 [Candidatus Omnitrophica bacterium CG1_02_49_16]PIU40299.1 MAG: hypothetical protein COT00_02420 [Candidatus Omnitrophica bacterium CG07_land_8_20_14_0_80_50_8]